MEAVNRGRQLWLVQISTYILVDEWRSPDSSRLTGQTEVTDFNVKCPAVFRKRSFVCLRSRLPRARLCRKFRATSGIARDNPTTLSEHNLCHPLLAIDCEVPRWEVGGEKGLGGVDGITS